MFEELDFAKTEEYLRSISPNCSVCIEENVFIGEKEKLPVRMILQALPIENKNERLRKIQLQAKKKGRKTSNAVKERLGLNIYITNTDSKMLDKDHVRVLYSLRWQIELIFKCWKSLGQIHQIKKMKVDRFESFLYARLLWLLICWKIYYRCNTVYYKENKVLLSVFKVYQTLQEEIKEFRNSLSKNAQKLQGFLVSIMKNLGSLYLLEKKKHKLSQNEIFGLLI